MNLFGRAKSNKPAPKDAIIRLRETITMLEKRESFLQTKIDNEIKVAKLNVTKNKKMAMMALKRKKAYEKEVEKISGAKMTLETQVMTIEGANLNLETLNALKTGADAMKSVHGAMDINKVDQTMDEIRDQMDVANEISDAISQPMGLGLEMDDDELLAELDTLEQEELDAKLLEVAAPSLPSVPQKKEQVAAPEEEDEEAELRALQASMAI